MWINSLLVWHRTTTMSAAIDPSQSSMYDTNPCPPLYYLRSKRVKVDVVDEDGNRYYFVMRQKGLLEWFNKCDKLQRAIDTCYDETKQHQLVFVQQSEEGKANKSEFVPPMAGSIIKSSPNNDDEFLEEWDVIQIGQGSSHGGYSVRALLWAVVVSRSPGKSAK
jgi:hypothetical protein